MKNVTDSSKGKERSSA